MNLTVDYISKKLALYYKQAHQQISMETTLFSLQKRNLCTTNLLVFDLSGTSIVSNFEEGAKLECFKFLLLYTYNSTDQLIYYSLIKFYA